MAVGLGADVTVIDRDLGRLKALDAQYAGRVRTVFSTRMRSSAMCLAADLVIGTVLVPWRRGAQADHPRPGRGDAPGRGDRRRRGRSGRLLRNHPANHARNADLRRERRRALLRRQHAGRRRAHLDLRAQQRDAPLRHRARRQGLAARRSPTTRTSRTASTSARAASPSRRSRAIWRSTTRPPKPALPKPPERRTDTCWLNSLPAVRSRTSRTRACSASRPMSAAGGPRPRTAR